MKKVGSFFFAFVPFLLVTGIQYLVTFFSMGTAALTEVTWYIFSNTADIRSIVDDLDDFWISQRFNTYLMVVYAVITIAVFGVWYYMKYDGNYLPSPRTVFHPVSILGIVMLVPGTQFLSTYIVAFTATLFPAWLEEYEELLEYAGLDERITIGMFIYSVLLAPISEELIFRGVTMRQAKKVLPFWVANLLQAFLFGVFHGNMMQGIYAFCLGFLLGYVCEMGGSIYNSILLHMLFNFWGTVISEFLDYGNTVFSFLFWLMFGIAVTAAGVLVFHLGAKKCREAVQAAAAPATVGPGTFDPTQPR